MSKVNQPEEGLSMTELSHGNKGVALSKVGLPSLLLKRTESGYAFVLLSPNKRNVATLGQEPTKRSVGTFLEAKAEGKILFREEFISNFPILNEGYVERTSAGDYIFVYASSKEELPQTHYSYTEQVNKRKNKSRSQEVASLKAQVAQELELELEQEHKHSCCACQQAEHTTLDSVALPNDDIEIIAALFRGLSSPARCSIVYLLLQHKQLSVGELSHLTNISISAVSHQLALLRMQNLVKVTRSGAKNYYALCDDHVAKLIEIAIEHIRE